MILYRIFAARRALEYTQLVEETLVKGFASNPLAKSLRVKDKEYCLDPKTSICQTVINDVHKTSCIETIYQVGVQNTRDNMLLELFIQLINEPCFNTLRTQEQLGYIVFRYIPYKIRHSYRMLYPIKLFLLIDLPFSNIIKLSF